jgi:hypothetical protein
VNRYFSPRNSTSIDDSPKVVYFYRFMFLALHQLSNKI